MSDFLMKNPCKILILEDLSEDIELIIDQFANSNIEVEYLSTNEREEFNRLLEDFQPDVVFLDYTLPTIDGLEALNIIRKKDEFIPVIFVTGTLGVEKAVDTMQHGANDFVLKQNISDLPSAVYRAMRDSHHRYERQKAEYAMRESEERFRIAADSAPVLLFMLDVNQNGTFFNRSWREFTELSEEELKGNGWLDTVYVDDREQFLKELETAYQHKERFKKEFRLKKDEAGFRWMLVWGNPRLDPSGNFLGYICSCIDIHELKVLDKNKDDFLSIASHELRTPLTSVKAYLSLLQTKLKKTNNVDGDFSFFLNKAESATERLNSLVHSLLDISRIENNKVLLNKKIVEYDSFVTGFIADYQDLSDQHELRLTGKTGATIYADKEKLEQILTNLISNAIKYSPDSKWIDIHLSKESDFIITSVKDYGIGVSEENQKNLFDRYYRVEGNRKMYAGLGIGLFVTKQFVELHNGEVWVKSQLGEGTTFYVKLPVHHE